MKQKSISFNFDVTTNSRSPLLKREVPFATGTASKGTFAIANLMKKAA